MNPKIELQLLKIRNLIADKEFEVACANREQSLGGWQCDHPGMIASISQEIDAQVRYANTLIDAARQLPSTT